MKAADSMFTNIVRKRSAEGGVKHDGEKYKQKNKKTKKNYDFAWLSVFLAFSRGCVANKKKDGPDFVG